MPKKAPQPTPSATPALDALEAWMNAPTQHEDTTLSRWAPVADLLTQVIARTGNPTVDPFLLPLA